MDNKENKKRRSASNEPSKRPKRGFGWLLYAAMFLILGLMMMPGKDKETSKELSYTKFTTYIEKDHVEKVVIYDDNHAKGRKFHRLKSGSTLTIHSPCR